MSTWPSKNCCSLHRPSLSKTRRPHSINRSSWISSCHSRCRTC